MNVYMIFCDLFHINFKLQLSKKDIKRIKKILNCKLPHVCNIKQAGEIQQLLPESQCLPVYRRQYLYKSNPFGFILGQDIQHTMTKFGVCHSFFCLK